MELYLVRHAIAEQRDLERWPDDSRRPLTAAGIERFRIVARGLRRLGIEVEAVLSSAYLRAWETAELLTAEAEWPKPEECAALEPTTPRTACLDALRNRPESALALVGHQPLLSELAVLLLAGDESPMRLELKKGGVLCLRFTAAPEAAAGALRWSVEPQDSRLDRTLTLLGRRSGVRARERERRSFAQSAPTDFEVTTQTPCDLGEHERSSEEGLGAFRRYPM